MAHHHPSHQYNNDHGKAFVTAIILNTGFVVAEFGYGFIANSTALMADAGHNLSDVLGLFVAWGAAILSKKAATNRYTYGFGGSSILAALANAMLLLVACGAIAWEAVHRFFAPPQVAGLTVTLVAAAGIVVNGLSAWLFMREGKHGNKTDLNIRGAYLHMASDAAVSLGVVIAGIAMMTTGWNWIDPVVSLGIVVVILASTWGLLRESMRLSLAAVPANIDADAVAGFLKQQAGVSAIHDLHIWGLSTTDAALTVHLVMPNGHPGDAYLDELVNTLKTKFDIAHSTVQIETNWRRGRDSNPR